MSRFRDYINLVREGIPNLDKLAEGILNQVKDEFDLLGVEEQEEIARRRLICQSCPLFSLNAKEDDSEYQKLFNKPFEFDPIRNKYCGVCGCPYKTRTSSLSAVCGLENYNLQNPEKQVPLKWEKYEKSN